MQIKGKSIRNLNAVLKLAGSLKEIKLAFKVEGEDPSMWEKLGFRHNLDVGHYLIPSVIGKLLVSMLVVTKLYEKISLNSPNQ